MADIYKVFFKIHIVYTISNVFKLEVLNHYEEGVTKRGRILFSRTPTTIKALLLMRTFNLLKTQWYDQESNFRKI